MIRQVLVNTLILSTTLALLSSCAATSNGNAQWDLASSKQIKNNDLSLTLETSKDGKYWKLMIDDNQTNRTWSAVSKPRWNGTLLSSQQTDDDTITLKIQSPNKKHRFNAVIDLTDDHSVMMSLSTETPNERFEDGLYFPPPFTTELTNGHLLFTDRSAGLFIPQTDQTYAGRPMRVFGNTQALDLPFIGVLEDTSTANDGMMMLYHTPFNAGLRYFDFGDGKQWPAPYWFASLEKFGYDRKLELRFQNSGGPVAMAKDYREIAKSEGKIDTLENRIDKRPRVEWLKGAPIIWGADGLQFVQEARARGITRALINGQFPPGEMETMKEMKILTGNYDSYTDIQEGPPGFHYDDVEEAAYRTSDGSLREGWRTLWGTQYYVRSHALAKSRAELYVPPILEEFPYTARFIDVSAAIEPYEDYKPGRVFDARQDIEYRRDLFRYFTDDLDLILGGEHTKDWSMPLFDYTEGTMSSPFWWKSNKSGHLIRFDTLEELPKRYLEFGMNHANRYPLWDLVYHDVVVNTWYWGDSSGYMHNIAPDLSDRKDLLNILHGTPPLYWVNHLGYGWNRNRERLIESWRNTCHWHAKVGFEELLDHEYLTEDRMVQRTSFASGAQAIVNFGEEPYELQTPQKMILPQYGFYAQTADASLVQSRQLIDGNIVTNIQSNEFQSISSQTEYKNQTATGSGTIDLFLNDENDWQVAASGEWKINLSSFLNDEQIENLRIIELSEDGRGKFERTEMLQGNSLSIKTPSASPILFKLEADYELEDALILPNGGGLEEGEFVRLSSAVPNSTIRYTLDGSEVSESSQQYTEPISLTTGAILKAQTFINGKEVGKVAEADFHPSIIFISEAIHRGGETPLQVDLDVSGIEQLELRFGDAGDGYEFDSTAIAEAFLTKKDGTKVSLVDVDPIFSYQSTPDQIEIGSDLIVELGGQNYKGGIKGHADSKLIYDLNGEYTNFTALMGNRDRDSGAGSVSISIEGKY